MAISHIGRLLRQRAIEEQRKIGDHLLDNVAKDFSEVKYWVGYVQGIRWAIDMLETIESEGE